MQDVDAVKTIGIVANVNAILKKNNVDVAAKVKRYVVLDQNQNVVAVVLKKIKEVITAKKRKARNSFSYIVKVQIFFVIEL